MKQLKLTRKETRLLIKSYKVYDNNEKHDDNLMMIDILSTSLRSLADDDLGIIICLDHIINEISNVISFILAKESTNPLTTIDQHIEQMILVQMRSKCITNLN